MPGANCAVIFLRSSGMIFVLFGLQFSFRKPLQPL